jgi:hypothetical protein
MRPPLAEAVVCWNTNRPRTYEGPERSAKLAGPLAYYDRFLRVI